MTSFLIFRGRLQWEQLCKVFKVVKVVSQLPAVIWPSMTLMLALLVLVSLPRIGSVLPGSVGNLPEIDSYGRLVFELNEYKCTILGVDHES